MSDEQKDGGPAFPCDYLGEKARLVRAEGMTLRDWFAGQALVGVLACPRAPRINGKAVSGVAEHAEWAYAQADAMLAARKEPPHAG